METKNLSELSERELEEKEKTFKGVFYLMAGIGVFAPLVIMISMYIRYAATQTIDLGAGTILFGFIVPIYMAFRAKKEHDEIKAEFERRRYR